MSLRNRLGSLLALSSLALTLGSPPPAAHANDSITALSQTEMASALQAAGVLSAAAGRDGWEFRKSLMQGSSGSYVASTVIDTDTAIVLDRTPDRSVYLVGGKGTFTSTGDPLSQKVLAMMGRHGTRYSFRPDVPMPGMGPSGYLPEPLQMLTADWNEGIRTSHDDGTVDYAFRDAVGTSVTVSVDNTGLLRAYRETGEDFTNTGSWVYEPRHIVAPAGSVTISQAVLYQATEWYFMPGMVSDTVREAASEVRRANKGRRVSVTSLRSIVRQHAQTTNATSEVRMMVVTKLHGGVRVSARNPWTHKAVAYTIKANGRKVAVKRTS